MNKLLLSFLLLAASLSATTTIEVRGSAVIPTAHRFRHVYGNTLASYGIEASTTLCNDLILWDNFDRVDKRRHLSGCGHSRIHLTTYSLGLKKAFCVRECLSSYLGLGLSLADIRIKNTQTSYTSHSRKTSLGLVLKSGLVLSLTDCLFLDLFADYYYQPVHYHHNTNAGAFRLGLGLGIALP